MISVTGQALGEARAALLGYGRELAGLCDELGLAAIVLTADVSDGGRTVSLAGMDHDDRVAISCRVDVGEGVRA